MVNGRMWRPIEDLPESWSSLSDGEFGPLLQYWKDQRSALEQSKAFEQFNARLSREWAIETGQIEGIYNLDRGLTATLIDRGIDANLIGRLAGQRDPEVIAAILSDHEHVFEGLFQFVRGDRSISKGYIHELHAALLRHQDTATVVNQFGQVFETELLKGRYKQRPNNPTRPDGSVHEYSPPEHVDSEMERLIAMHAEHEAHIPVEIEAAWLHHRFVQIHPYQDGNGRVARALASLVFIKAGSFPLVVTRDDRARYIEALEIADQGDLRPSVALFVNIQRRALLQAIRAAADAQPSETVEEAVAALKHALFARRATDSVLWLRTKETADRLMEIARERLEGLVNTLSAEIGTGEFTFEVDLFPRAHLEGEYSREAVLGILSQSTANGVFAVEALGSRTQDLIQFDLKWRRSNEEQIVSEEPFQTNYAEPPDNAERRFRSWLERSLARALTLWRRSLP